MIAEKIAGLFKSQSSFAIVSHVMPDGDSIGSSLALLNVLKILNKDADVYISDTLPGVYSFLPGCDQLLTYKSAPLKSYDVLVSLDCGSLDRTGDCASISNRCKTTVNIDHHGTNSLFADLNLVDTNASATGELLYYIIKLMGVDLKREVAECLYTAILTDTGCFRYSNTTSTTHEIAGDLINTGINFGRIYEQIYNNYDYESVKLLGIALQSLELLYGGKAAYIQLELKDYEYVSNEVSTSDFINYARDISSVEVAVFAKETTEGEIKLSFRSKSYADVKSICEKYGGGGHMHAAGCTINGRIKDVKIQILKDIENSLKSDII